MEAPNVLKCDVSNMFTIGNMRHGDFLNVALGKDHTIEIFAHLPLGTNDLVYDYEVKRLGERVTLVHGATKHLLSSECANLVMTSFE